MTPASSTVSSTERSGGTVRVSPERASSSSKAAAAPVSGRRDRGEPFDAQRAGRPARALLLHRPQQGLGTAGVHQGALLGHAEVGGEVQEAVLVLRTDEHPVPVRGEAVQERHGGPGAAAVQQTPVGPRGLGGLDHGKDGRDADAAGDEQMAGGRP